MTPPDICVIFWYNDRGHVADPQAKNPGQLGVKVSHAVKLYLSCTATEYCMPSDSSGLASNPTS